MNSIAFASCINYILRREKNKPADLENLRCCFQISYKDTEKYNVAQAPWRETSKLSFGEIPKHAVTTWARIRKNLWSNKKSVIHSWVIFSAFKNPLPSSFFFLFVCSLTMQKYQLWNTPFNMQKSVSKLQCPRVHVLRPKTVSKLIKVTCGTAVEKKLRTLLWKKKKRNCSLCLPLGKIQLKIWVLINKT